MKSPLKRFTWTAALSVALFRARGQEISLPDQIYNPGPLKPIDSRLKVRVGQPAPDFDLPGIHRRRIRLSEFRGRKIVVISFVPAAWTPLSSAQWPGYDLAKPLFDKYDATLISVSVDNVPTLYAWTRAMGALWFPAASDFRPHGRVAQTYGVLRSDGTAERALFVIDKAGIIRYIDVHDINERPPPRCSCGRPPPRQRRPPGSSLSNR